MINEQIKSNSIRIVGGEELDNNIITLAKALELAEELDLDLVQMSTDNGVAVCKLMNYGKHIYEQEKRKKENKKYKPSVKEVRINYGIADNDLNIKANQISRMLKHGSTVKISITFKGRLVKLIDSGSDKLKQLLDLVDQTFKVESEIKKENNRVYTVIIPNNKK